MEVIVPAAGLSTRFPNMPPKYLLTDSNGNIQPLPIELPIIPNQSSHIVADANTAIASGQRYTLTLDRAIYIKP